jgi:hypothetical protein
VAQTSSVCSAETISAQRIEQSRGWSLGGTSLAAETKSVLWTGVGTLRFRAARVSKRILLRAKTTRFLESLNPAGKSCLRHIADH